MFLYLADWNFTLDNFDSVWKLLVQIGLILIFLLIGNVLRTLIPFLRKSLIPSALIGGTLLLITNIICKACGYELVDKSIMQVITYHGLAVGFIAITLKTAKKNKNAGKMEIIDSSLLMGGSYMIQAVFGLLITLIFYYCTVKSSNVIYYTSGLILPLGYGQGPGNALTWDINFTNTSAGMFTGNGSFGLSIASIGFIVASVIGVAYINYYKYKHQIEIKEYKGINERKVSDYEDENEIADSESVDKFSIQIGLVFLAYALAFLLMAALGSISDFTKNIAWGFNFFFGVIAATLVKLLIKFLRKIKLMKKQYINNYQMDRISGFAFDLMIVAGVAAIEINDVRRYVWPLIVLCTVGAIVTFLYVRIVCKYCFKDIQHEMFVTYFGTVTGTASNGMILLKEIDPKYETNASNLLILCQLPSMIVIAPILLLLDFASKSLRNTWICFGIFTFLIIVYIIILFRKQIFRIKPKGNIENQEKVIEEPTK